LLGAAALGLITGHTLRRGSLLYRARARAAHRQVGHPVQPHGLSVHVAPPRL